MLILPGPVRAAEPDLTAILRQAGALDLARQRFEQSRPDPAGQPAAWMDWARERVRLEEMRGDAQAVLALLEPLPEGVSPEFQAWAQAQLAQADLTLGRGKAARLRLARLIWSGAGDEADQAAWRRVVMRCYLQEGLAEDAYTAMVRYQQDVGGDDTDWLALRAEVLLASQRPADAAALLAGQAVPSLRVLYLIAAHRSGALLPADLVREAGALATAEDLPPAGQRRLWSLARDTAEGPTEGIVAMEHLLVLGVGAPDALASGTSADALWQAYEDCGRTAGAQAQLPAADALPWLDAARRVEAQRPVEARCMLAYGVRVAAPELRALAHAEFTRALLAQLGGRLLLWQLYMGAQRDGGHGVHPAIVRYALADEALNQGDLRIAFRLVSDLNQPPPGTDAWFWQARRARLMIAGGSHELGIAALQPLVEEPAALDAEHAAAALKVISDIQALGQHEAAVGLLRSLSLRVSDPELQRQILYWLADSLSAQAQYAEAATAWLQVAGAAQDAWAEAARYAAADALAHAGLSDDARRVLTGIVEHTTDPVLHTRAQRRLESLGLGR